MLGLAHLEDHGAGAVVERQVAVDVDQPGQQRAAREHEPERQIALPVVRGPFALAKTLGAIDILSGGRLDAGLGPGSSAADYALVGIPFDERWARFDESVAAIRALWEQVLAKAPAFESEQPLPTLASGEIALTTTIARDGSGVRAQVVRRQADGTWLRLLDQPEIGPPVKQ